MDLKKYQDYRRIYPKLRLSWTLYKLWVKKDWIDVWAYLTGMYSGRSEQQQQGTKVHKWIEDNGWQKVNGIERYLDVKKKYLQEEAVVLERESYQIVARPDLHDEIIVVDWKTGRSSGYEQQLQEYMWVISEKYNSNCDTGLLAEIEVKYNGEEIAEIGLAKVKQYEKSKYAGDWEYRFDEMANDIMNHLKYLNRYINLT